jgi:uncharacterized membrane protein YdjX (TVP38/TMEM64 family)
MRAASCPKLSMLNYSFGVTRVKVRDYIIASWIGMMPGTVMYVYLGSVARAGVNGQQRAPAEWALYGAGLAAIIFTFSAQPPNNKGCIAAERSGASNYAIG